MLELDLVSHNGSFTTLDIISPGFDRFRPPRRGDSAPIFPLGDVEGGVWGRMRSPAQNRRRRPLLDTPASTIKK